MHQIRKAILHGAVAMAAVVPASFLATQPAQAQSGTQAARTFNIPAGSLGSAIARLGRQANIMVTVDPALVRGRRTSGLRGSYTPEQALNALLANSGLTARPDGKGGFVLSAVTAVPNRSTASRRPVRRPAASPALDDSQEGEAEDIIVTGEKFARDTFNTFTSVRVVTAEEVDRYARQTLDEALNNTPNVRMFENSGFSSISIRGMNAEGPTAGSRSTNIISVTVDGAEQGAAATRNGTRGVWDVKQIEVLRGPQSTLQGRDALAGSLAIKTNDPTFSPELIFREEIDSDGLYSGAFAVSGPIISDQLAVRLSGQVTRDDKGISYSDPQWSSFGDEKFEEFRGKILITPSALPDLTALFTVSRTHDKPAYNLVSGPDFFARKYTTGGFEEFRDTIVWRCISDLKYEFGPELTLQSVTAFVDTATKIDSPRSPTFFRDETRDYGDFSQDLRLTYGSKDSRFSGVLGFYAGRYTNSGQSISDMDVFGLGFTIPLQRLESRGKNTSLAIYADGRYAFMDRWTLLAGGRLLHDKSSNNNKGSVLTGTPYEASIDETSTLSTTRFLPKIGLAFELSENQNIALTASKGYRRGFSQIIVGTADIIDVNPESMWDYEIAYRSKWLDDRLHINGNVFYYDYTNMQVPVPVPGLLGAGYDYTINAKKAHSYGAELEARWKFGSTLEVFAGLGLLKTEFDDAEYYGASLAGNEFPDAPSVTASLGAHYRHESGWFVGGDIAFTDGYYSRGEVRNRAAYAVDSFVVANAQAGYRTERFAFTAYVRNLLNERYVTGLGSDGTSASIGDARAIGLQLTQRF